MIPITFPLLSLWLGAALILLLDGRRRWVGLMALALVLLALTTASIILWGVVVHGPREVVTGGWQPGVGIRLRSDALGGLFTISSLIGIAGALVVELARGVESRVLPTLLVLLGAGLTGLFLTGDIFNFYVFFEVSMITSFALTAYGGEAREIRAAVIFTVVNLVGSVFFLGAVAALYRIAGTLDMAQLASAVDYQEGSSLLVATALFVALLLKVGIFPLHFWMPAVYRGARPIVAAVLAGAVANIGAYGLIRLGAEVFPQAVSAARPVVLGVGAVSIVYGAVLATSRRLSGEVLGYSAIGQAGYVLVALAVGGSLGIAAAVLYAVVNALNKTLLFLVDGFTGPVVATLFAVGAFSVAGVPPSAGFVGKVEMFRTAMGDDSAWLVALFVVGSALSFVYMFQAYQHKYWARGAAETAAQSRSPLSARALVLTLAALVVLIGLWPEPLLVATRAAAEAAAGVP